MLRGNINNSLASLAKLQIDEEEKNITILYGDSIIRKDKYKGQSSIWENAGNADSMHELNIQYTGYNAQGNSKGKKTRIRHQNVMKSERNEQQSPQQGLTRVKVSTIKFHVRGK